MRPPYLRTLLNNKICVLPTYAHYKTTIYGNDKDELIIDSKFIATLKKFMEQKELQGH